MNHEYIIIKGTATDNINDSDSLELTFAVKGIQPVFEKEGKDKKKVTGAMRGTRTRALRFHIPFVTLSVDKADDLGDYGDYWDLMKLVDGYEYIWLKSTNLVRVRSDGTNLWTALLPIKVILNDDGLEPIFEDGLDEYKLTFQVREPITISSY